MRSSYWAAVEDADIDLVGKTNFLTTRNVLMRAESFKIVSGLILSYWSLGTGQFCSSGSLMNTSIDFKMLIGHSSMSPRSCIKW